MSGIDIMNNVQPIILPLEELRESAARLGYELRRKGQKRDHGAIYDGDGEQLRNCYLPHLACTASVRARTIKLLDEARHQLGVRFNDYGTMFVCPETQWCDIWEHLLLALEHVIRNMKYETDGARFSCNLFVPLKRSEYVKPTKKGKDK